jgi:hypothetical protein
MFVGGSKVSPSAGVFVGVEWPEIWPGDNLAASFAGALGARAASPPDAW